MNAKWILIPFLVAGFFLAACSSAASTPYIASKQSSAPVVQVTAIAQASSRDQAKGTVEQKVQVPSSGSPAEGKMLIKDAQMDLLVENPDQALGQVLQTAADYGGYIISSQTWYKEQYKYATVRLGIPASNFESVLNVLRHTGLKVLQETASGNDVSSEYTDLQSKLANLEATSSRVRVFLNNATSVEESLKINQTLTDLEGQIEQVKGQMKYYEGRTAYSTITVNLNPYIPTPPPAPTPTPTPVPVWNPASTFEDASGVLVTTFHGVVDLLIWVLVAIGPYALILGFFYWLFRQIFLPKNRRTTREG